MLTTLASSVIQLPVRQALRRAALSSPAPSPRDFRRFGVRSWLVPPTTVHGPSFIDIGDDVVVMEHGHLAAVAAAERTPRLVIGDRVRLARFASIVASLEIVIEDEVSSSDNVVVADTWAGVLAPGHVRSAPLPAPTIIERGAYLGANAVVLPGVRIGAGAFVGEGAVVASDVAPRTVVYGNPAVTVRRFDAATSAWIGDRLP